MQQMVKRLTNRCFRRPQNTFRQNGLLCSRYPQSSAVLLLTPSRRWLHLKSPLLSPRDLPPIRKPEPKAVQDPLESDEDAPIPDIFDKSGSILQPLSVEDDMKVNTYSAMLYTTCANRYAFGDFVHHCGLTDTADTWQRLTVFHIWLVLSRLQADCGISECKMYRTNMQIGLNKDEQTRLLRLKMEGHFIAAQRPILHKWIGNWKQITSELDEALLDDDTILFGALWRNFYNYSPDVKLEQLEIFAKYFRREVKRLSKMRKSEILRRLDWRPVIESDEL